MTKQSMKELVTKWNIDMSKEYEKKQMYFEELQELNSIYGNGKKYCSAFENLKGLIGTQREYTAFELFSKYQQCNGTHFALIEFLRKTENFNL